MIITIGREKGSGGHYAGELLAKQLGIQCYDKSLLIETAQKSGFSQEFIEAHEEQTPTSRYASFAAGIMSSEYSHPVHQQVFEAQSKVIREIAEQGSCVFVGRCADFVLRNRTDIINCFVHAPLQKRIERIMKMENISHVEAERLIRKTDKSRASYYTFFTDRNWGEAKNYHIAIDTSIATIPGAVEIIKTAVLLSKYFRIRENKLRKLAEENPTSGWVILNGNRIQIKRKQFEKVIDTLDAI